MPLTTIVFVPALETTARKIAQADEGEDLPEPPRGRIRVLGAAPGSPEATRSIGVMPQEGGLYPSARPLPWLRYLAGLYPDPADPAELLARVGIDPGTRDIDLVAGGLHMAACAARRFPAVKGLQHRGGAARPRRPRRHGIERPLGR